MSNVAWPPSDQIAEMVLSALGWWLHPDDEAGFYSLDDINTGRIINVFRASSEDYALRIALEHARFYLIEMGMYDEPK